MTKPEITINQLSYPLETREILTPSRHSKPASSKSKLKNLVGTSPLTKNKAGKNPSNNSIHRQKTSLENGLKEFYSLKTYNSTEFFLPEKQSANTRADGKRNPPKYKSFFKDRSPKPKTLHISTNHSNQTSQSQIKDFRAFSAKNTLYLDDSSPQQKIFGTRNKSFLNNIKVSFPQSVKNSRSQAFEYPNSSKIANSTAISNHRLTLHPNQLSFNELNHKRLSLQNNALTKMLSAPKMKSREDRASINGLLASNLKVLEKRKSSCKKRRNNQFFDLNDDPTSKLSTKVPSQSEVRGSLPTQKSSTHKQDPLETMDDDCKTLSPSPKGYDIKTSEGKNSAKGKSKAAYIKDMYYNPIINRKAKSNALIYLDQTDTQIHTGPSSGNSCKVESLKSEDKKQPNQKGQESVSNKKNESGLLSDDKNLVDSAKETLKTFGSKSPVFTDYAGLFDELEDKEDDNVNSMSCISHHDSQDNIEYHGQFGSREFRRRELARAKAMLESTNPPQEEEMVAETPVLNEQETGLTLFNIIKRNSVQDIKFNPEAKFLLLRKQVQEKRALRDTKSFESINFNQLRELKSLQLTHNYESVKVSRLSSEKSPQARSGVTSKNLFGVLKKTKEMIENYQVKEKDWLYEKNALLTKIESLEQKSEKK